MDSYLTTPVGPYPTAIGTAINTFTTRRDVSPFPLPIIQGGTLRPGSKIKVEAEGEFSTTATPTLSIGCYIGSITGVITRPLAESAAITTGSGAASWQWRLEYRCICTVVGVSGTVIGCGNLELGTGLTTVSTTPIPTSLALRTASPWDTTIAQAIGVCATYSLSSISNAIKTYNLSVILYD